MVKVIKDVNVDEQTAKKFNEVYPKSDSEDSSWRYLSLPIYSELISYCTENNIDTDNGKKLIDTLFSDELKKRVVSKYPDWFSDELFCKSVFTSLGVNIKKYYNVDNQAE